MVEGHPRFAKPSRPVPFDKTDSRVPLSAESIFLHTLNPLRSRPFFDLVKSLSRSPARKRGFRALARGIWQ